MNKGDKNAQKFRSSIRHLEYVKKWFSKLRDVLYLEGQMKDMDSLLAPLSKRYHLSAEELKNELSSFFLDADQLCLIVNNTIQGGIDKKTTTTFAVGCGITVNASQYPAGQTDIDSLGRIIEQNPIDFDHGPQPPCKL